MRNWLPFGEPTSSGFTASYGTMCHGSTPEDKPQWKEKYDENTQADDVHRDRHGDSFSGTGSGQQDDQDRIRRRLSALERGRYSKKIRVTHRLFVERPVILRVRMRVRRTMRHIFFVHSKVKIIHINYDRFTTSLHNVNQVRDAPVHEQLEN
jgi:hypothetical protein